MKLNIKNSPSLWRWYKWNHDNRIANRWYVGCPTLVVSLGILFWSTTATTALLDETQVNEGNNLDAPGGLINRSLVDQVGPGMGDWDLYGSSSYVINRDPLRSVRRGRQLFQRKFSEQEGLGPRVNFSSTGDLTAHRALGAGSADSCSACHGNPKGSAGVGGNVATFPDGRDAPHLFGLGIVEQLADEITWALRGIRDSTKREAATNKVSVKSKLLAKKIDYGYIIAKPDGSVDYSEIVGVDSDLRVKPFFAQGKTISIREFIVGAFKDEMGLEAWDPVLCEATDSANTKVISSNSGFQYDPTQDTFERPPVCSPAEDNDNDGITAELDPAIVDHLEFYLLNYFKPGTSKQTRIEQSGLDHLRKSGCTGCHVQNFSINEDRRVADVETIYDPTNGGVFNQLFATAAGRFDVVEDGQQYPLIQPQYERFEVKDIFTDFKRHDLGPLFHERDYDGTVHTMFMTEPLWGVGSTAPYGHDGRSIDLDQVIRRHGGEAERSKLAYVNRLNDREKQELQAYLRSLILFPPDDTASNLNPGNPQTTNPQSPSEHGSISLPALFQIDELGVE